MTVNEQRLRNAVGDHCFTLDLSENQADTCRLYALRLTRAPHFASEEQALMQAKMLAELYHKHNRLAGELRYVC